MKTIKWLTGLLLLTAGGSASAVPFIHVTFAATDAVTSEFVRVSLRFEIDRPAGSGKTQLVGGSVYSSVTNKKENTYIAAETFTDAIIPDPKTPGDWLLAPEFELEFNTRDRTVPKPWPVHHHKFSSTKKSPVYVFDTYTTKEYFISQTPEPATWAMLIAGFGAVGAVMRRRRATLQPA